MFFVNKKHKRETQIKSYVNIYVLFKLTMNVENFLQKNTIEIKLRLLCVENIVIFVKNKEQGNAIEDNKT